ncbi:hypothetical protein F442_20241 [Phytophthora nicotianae P10297]|uniref:Uncharacterized protein n=2 Tax=Phytophthora nicotianae TaxID=4792 RepID=W2QUD9_PHYN3|nr:hypothetical protein PPTG_21746 [Phytophthora nicotianae INRA-310]ETN16581.1 hypothetical protein PPTG_21746 [Phytophthora nicotianae INRA-310]ETP30847.1 hypothetical protein F442_20241 [Phytophthora nicotianae P10297]
MVPSECESDYKFYESKLSDTRSISAQYLASIEKRIVSPIYSTKNTFNHRCTLRTPARKFPSKKNDKHRFLRMPMKNWAIQAPGTYRSTQSRRHAHV